MKGVDSDLPHLLRLPPSREWGDSPLHPAPPPPAAVSPPPRPEGGPRRSPVTSRSRRPPAGTRGPGRGGRRPAARPVVTFRQRPFPGGAERSRVPRPRGPGHLAGCCHGAGTPPHRRPRPGVGGVGGCWEDPTGSFLPGASLFCFVVLSRPNFPGRWGHPSLCQLFPGETPVTAPGPRVSLGLGFFLGQQPLLSSGQPGWQDGWMLLSHLLSPLLPVYG